jgi:hypothetical protein
MAVQLETLNSSRRACGSLKISRSLGICEQSVQQNCWVQEGWSDDVRILQNEGLRTLCTSSKNLGG